MYISDHPPKFKAQTGLRPIAKIVASLIPKLIIRFHLNEAMTAATPVAAVNAFIEADGLRRLAGLTWGQALSDINDNLRDWGPHDQL